MCDRAAQGDDAPQPGFSCAKLSQHPLCSGGATSSGRAALKSLWRVQAKCQGAQGQLCPQKPQFNSPGVAPPAQ